MTWLWGADLSGLTSGTTYTTHGGSQQRPDHLGGGPHVHDYDSAGRDDWQPVADHAVHGYRDRTRKPAGQVGVHAGLVGLTPTTTYHYQLVAHSSGGTTCGADQTLTSTSSQAVVLGREGFVSPGRVVGVELGCFHGTSTSTGHLTMTHNCTVIAQRNYAIGAESGGF